MEVAHRAPVEIPQKVYRVIRSRIYGRFIPDGAPFFSSKY
jgi:hypothetical protein